MGKCVFNVYFFLCVCLNLNLFFIPSKGTNFFVIIFFYTTILLSPPISFPSFFSLWKLLNDKRERKMRGWVKIELKLKTWLCEYIFYNGNFFNLFFFRFSNFTQKLFLVLKESISSPFIFMEIYK